MSEGRRSLSDARIAMESQACSPKPKQYCSCGEEAVDMHVSQKKALCMCIQQFT